MAGILGEKRDFFISRAGEDKDVALVIDEILRGAGYSTFIQDKDFGHTAFTERMDQGFRMVEAGARIVALLSRAYQDKPHCRAEAQYPLTDDPTNSRQRLIVLRIEECAPIGFLKPIPYVDLVSLLHDGAAVREAVLGAVDPARHPKAADFAALYRRSGTQIIHPEVRPVPGFTARGDELAALEAALWRKSGRVAITDVPTHGAASIPPPLTPPRKGEGNPVGASGEGKNAAAAAVRGMGGVGKSVLAQQYAWDNRERYQGVWWVRAEARETLLDDLIALGSRFVDKLAEMPDRAAAARIVLDHIAQTRWEKPWLIIYDNVESPAAIDNLTPASGAHVFVTTPWSDWYGHAEEVPVDVFSREVAIDYLMERARSGDARPAETRVAAEGLAEELGRLPLALAIARAHAWSMNWTLELYRAHLAELLDRDPAKLVDYPRSISATFTLALEKATSTRAESELLLSIAAFLAPDRIPLDIITTDIVSEIAKGEAVAALAEVSLVTRETLDDGSPGISVHRLVQQVVRQRLGDGGAELAALATRVVAEAYPAAPSDVRTWAACQRLQSHVVTVLSAAPEDWRAGAGWLLNQYAVHLTARAEFAAAEPLLRRAAAIDEATFGPDHPHVSRDIDNLANLLWAMHRPAEAEPLYRRALAIDEARFGPDHPRVAFHLGNLAGLLSGTNQLVDAERLIRRALAIFETRFGPEHSHVATCLNNLAALLHDTNRFAQGRETPGSAAWLLSTCGADSGVRLRRASMTLPSWSKSSSLPREDARSISSAPGDAAQA